MNFLDKHYFLIRKLHVITGLLPVGIFLLIHLTINSYVLISPEVYTQRAALMKELPFLTFLEVGFIFLPILYHGLLGLWVVYVAKNNVLKFKYSRNWAFYLQRITAIVTFIFLIYHVITTRFSGAEINYEFMSNILASPGMLIFYIVGVVGSVYHFANGLWAFFIDLGITVGPNAQRVSAIASTFLFVVLSILSVQILLAF
ncbi:MAG: succinate dehydrogenase [Peptococcales bacterium]|jgi:succinate dehydrogenase / fumarate reductase cytochrome b subunit